MLINISMKNQSKDEDLEGLKHGICSLKTKSDTPEVIFFR